MKFGFLRGKSSVLALLGVCAITVGTLAAPPPGKGGGNGGGGEEPVPVGRIYFRTNVIDPVTGNGMDVGDSMLADGSDVRASELKRPSRMLHNGERWFLDFIFICLEEDADGICLRGTTEVVAIRESDGFQVQLTDDENLFAGARSQVRWGKDDSYIAFLGVVAGTEEDLIYTADLAFDAQGLPYLSTTPAAVLSAGAPFVVDGVTYLNNLDDFDMSPDGTEVVWARVIHEQGFRRASDPKEILVTDLVAGTTDVIAAGREPEWSPDGSAIAFAWIHNDGHAGGIATIAPDGTGYLELTPDGGNQWLYDADPVWSPDSQHVAFKRLSTSIKKGKTTFIHDIYRIPAAGGSPVNMTANINNATPLGWR